jgi:hypothetical protein
MSLYFVALVDGLYRNKCQLVIDKPLPLFVIASSEINLYGIYVMDIT